MRPYLSAFTGILKAQSRQNIGTSICGIWRFFSFELFIQLYGQGHHARPFPSIIFKVPIYKKYACLHLNENPIFDSI